MPFAQQCAALGRRGRAVERALRLVGTRNRALDVVAVHVGHLSQDLLGRRFCAPVSVAVGLGNRVDAPTKDVERRAVLCLRPFAVDKGLRDQETLVFDLATCQRWLAWLRHTIPSRSTVR